MNSRKKYCVCWDNSVELHYQANVKLNLRIGILMETYEFNNSRLTLYADDGNSSRSETQLFHLTPRLSGAHKRYRESIKFHSSRKSQLIAHTIRFSLFNQTPLLNTEYAMYNHIFHSNPSLTTKTFIHEQKFPFTF